MNPFRFYAGLFCITMATLMLQIIQTRILSVVLWYYLVFFVISSAMFGLTVGAVWVYVQKERFSPRTLSDDLSRYSVLFAISVAACLVLQTTLAPVNIPTATTVVIWLELVATVTIPFVFSGIVVSLALTRSPFPIGRVYAADLAGAAAGCLGVLGLLQLTDGASAVLWVSVLVMIGALLFAGAGKAGEGAPTSSHPMLDVLHRRRAWVLGILVVIAAANHMDRNGHGFKPVFVKYQIELTGSRPIFEEWNSYSRIAVARKPYRTPIMWGASPKFEAWNWLVDQRHVSIDGGASTFAYRYDKDLGNAGFLKYDVTSVAYHLPKLEKALVVGVGAGRDMATAKVFGVRETVGVEINPILLRLLTTEPGFADFTGIGDTEGFSFHAAEARSWITRSNERFDLIQMSLVDTRAAVSAGAQSLSENGLYTVEAWRQFIDHLTDGGYFTVSRWYHPNNLDETGRMLSLSVAALLEQGVVAPAEHIFMATAGEIATIIVARRPFTRDSLTALEDAARRYGFGVAISPLRPVPSPVLHRILTAETRQSLDRISADLPLDLSPPTDDSPFFFNLLPPLHLSRLIAAMNNPQPDTVLTGNLIAAKTLLFLLVLSTALVLTTIVLPLRWAIADVGWRLAVAGTGYFALIGVGFMVAEVVFVQRFSVFLGQPTYSLGVVLFSLILATGAGSLISDRWHLGDRRTFGLWSLATAGYLFALPWWLPTVTAEYAAEPMAMRALLCVLIIAPVGLLMGYGFPTGMRLISAVNTRPTPWYWGINGAAGVTASALAVSASISFGISQTLMIAGLCYLALIPAAFIIGFPGKAR